MENAHILSIDLAQRSFQVCATDRAGSCVDASQIARRFSDFARQSASSVVCQASGVACWRHGPLCSSNDPGHIGSASWFALAPGLVSRIVNIEVLAA